MNSVTADHQALALICSLTMELDSQAGSVRGGHERDARSLSNNNEVSLCKLASESLVEIPSNDICL